MSCKNLILSVPSAVERDFFALQDEVLLGDAQNEVRYLRLLEGIEEAECRLRENKRLEEGLREKDWGSVSVDALSDHHFRKERMERDLSFGRINLSARLI